MKSLLIVALLVSSPAFALDLSCKGEGESISINVHADKIVVSGDYGELRRETKDQDCGYRSARFACYEEGQFMVNIPLALANGKVKNGTVYVQLDTGDNVDAHNHALLGAPYACVAE